MDNDTILAALRQELNYKVIEENGERFIVLSDPQEIALQHIALPVDLIPLLQLMNGTYTKNGIISLLSEQIESGADVVTNTFFELYANLDHLGYLDSPRFQFMKSDIENYLAADLRQPVCAGNTYSSDPDELSNEINTLISSINPESISKGANAIIVPHIDFQIGEEAHKCYASGYHAIRDTKADLFVILGTSHHSYSCEFMFTKKDFITPLGSVSTDRQIINKVRNQLSFNLSIDDRAHRYEHSIELQIVLLQHLFSDRDFTILPILVGSFGNHVLNGSLPNYDNKFSEFITVLKNVIIESGRNTVMIASVDFAHIGRKFGDYFDAEPLLEELKQEDEVLIEHLEHGDADSFFRQVTQVKDRNKICGLSPIYSLVNLMNGEKFKFLNYGQWNETETKSAVSFASLASYPI